MHCFVVVIIIEIDCNSFNSTFRAAVGKLIDCDFFLYFSISTIELLEIRLCGATMQHDLRYTDTKSMDDYKLKPIILLYLFQWNGTYSQQPSSFAFFEARSYSCFFSPQTKTNENIHDFTSEREKKERQQQHQSYTFFAPSHHNIDLLHRSFLFQMRTFNILWLHSSLSSDFSRILMWIFVWNILFFRIIFSIIFWNSILNSFQFVLTSLWFG